MSFNLKQWSWVLGSFTMLALFSLSRDDHASVRTPPARRELRSVSRRDNTYNQMLTKTDNQVVLNNGLVQLTFSYPGGDVIGIKYKGIDNLLDIKNQPSNRGYWDLVWNKPGEKGSVDKLQGTRFNVTSATADQIEISFTKTYSASLGNATVPLNVDKRYIMQRGRSGFYAYAIFERLKGWPEVDMDQIRIVYKLQQDKFRYMAISDDRKRVMPTADDRANGQPLAYPEAVLLTNPSNPEFRGEVDDKYQYSSEDKDNNVHGWICKDPAVGFWIITPSDEFRTAGPFKQDLTSHVGPTALSMFVSTHYAGKEVGMTFEDGEAWKKVFGPVFIHLNSAPSSTEISADLPSHHRHSLYTSSNVFFITPRILIVDLLTKKLPTSQIAGLIIPTVHSLTETSTEAFIVRIFRSLNKTAFVRAFSDKPHSMVSGFAKAERIMKCLYIRKMHLWPRFHVDVSQELERDAPEVVDIRVPMTKHMVGIQKAIIEVMDACLKEMRKTNKVDVEDLTVENGLFKSFDEIVRRQLDPIWHTLGKKTKQLVSDLKTLRKLLDYLVRYDAVTYLKYLDTLRVSESFRSVWIFAESSYKIFEYAKKRVYRFVTSDGVMLSDKGKSSKGKKRKLKGDDDKEQVGGTSSTSTSSGVVLDEVLEEAPKWKVLREVLEEIEEERKQAFPRGEHLVEEDDDDSGIVLVACKDERSCMQLEDFITNGPHKVMRDEWENYLLGKGELRDLHTRFKKKPKKPKGFGILDGVVHAPTPQNAEASSINKQENDALLAAAAEIRKRAKKDDAVGDDPQLPVSGRGRGKGTVVAIKPPQNAEASSGNKQEHDVLLASASEIRKQAKKNEAVGDDPPLRGKGRGKGRGKVRNKKGPANVKSLGNNDDNNDKKEAILDKLVISDSENEGQADQLNQVVTADSSEATCQGDTVDQGVLRKHTGEADSTVSRNAKPLPPVHFYALESGQPILDILRPSTIIVYHPDMSFVREIEVHKAENPSKKLKVYFLFYEESSEVQKFEASIRRENAAFESLIRQKSLMMIPVDQDGNCLGLNSSLEPQTMSSQNSVTRKAGGRKEVEKEMQVIVDMREFMSSLPNVLHQKGMHIIPVTLEVGDYILSPLICVERKSIQDLFMSFTSGRLYHQVETMVRYYRIPVLLIEFSQDKSFSFQSASDIGDDVTPNSIISKLSLLALHFPRLRIIWSRSLHATAEIFATLKANQDEPDETKAMRVGVPSEDGIVEDDVRAENYNTSAVEFLRRLPGVTDSNYRAIMDGCKSLAELALMPVERLAELMGGQKAARTLRDFLDAKYPTLL